MSRTDFPDALLLEGLTERFGHASCWSLGAPATKNTQVVFVGKYKAYGVLAEPTHYSSGDCFMVTSWDIVIPLTENEVRLNQALDVLSTVSRLVSKEYLSEELDNRIQRVLAPNG